MGWIALFEICLSSKLLKIFKDSNYLNVLNLKSLYFKYTIYLYAHIWKICTKTKSWHIIHKQPSYIYIYMYVTQTSAIWSLLWCIPIRYTPGQRHNSWMFWKLLNVGQAPTFKTFNSSGIDCFKCFKCFKSF